MCKNTVDYDSIIGSVVSGIIDRPMGSKHPDFDLIYPINYGYVNNVIAGDGDFQDVYILGVDHPIESFTGKVIAVFQRFNDNEDKWIVSMDNHDYTKEEIMDAIRFQEKYFEGMLHC